MLILVKSRRDGPVLDRIMALLEKIGDEQLLETIYWYIERKLTRTPPAK